MLMADKMDTAFAQVTKLLFGKPLSPWKKYCKWLSQSVPGGKSVPSCFGHGTAYVPDYGFFSKVPEKKVASDEDAPIAAGKTIGKISDVESISSIASRLKDFAYFVPTYSEGKNIDVENAFSTLDCINVRESFDPWTSKNCSHVFSIMESESLFGAHRVINSSFSMHIYNAYYVQRCFEIDGAKNCNDSYFCHNVENLDSCMFCFNTKSKRYAIGNRVVGKEKYLQIKAQLLERIVPELENSGRLSFGIYDLLAKRPKSRP